MTGKPAIFHLQPFSASGTETERTGGCGKHEDLTKEQGDFADRYFEENVYPVLTPMAVDSSRPFPLIRNKSLNIGALIAKKDDPEKKGRFCDRTGSFCTAPSGTSAGWKGWRKTGDPS